MAIRPYSTSSLRDSDVVVHQARNLFHPEMQASRGAVYLEIEELYDATDMVNTALQASGFTGHGERAWGARRDSSSDRVP